MKIYLYGPVNETVINAYSQYLNTIDKLAHCSEERIVSRYRKFQVAKEAVEALLQEFTPLHIWQEDEFDKLFTDEKTKALFMNGLRNQENWFTLLNADSNLIADDFDKALADLLKSSAKEDMFLFWNMN